MIPADVAARAGTRLHALDAIRASALLLGICLHASLSLVPTRGLVFWPVSDVQQSTALTVAGFVPSTTSTGATASAALRSKPVSITS